MSEFLKGPQNIIDFVKFHNTCYIYYCEVIIHPNGNVEYCIPSHQECLIRQIGLTKEELFKTDLCIDMKDLVNMTQCVSVWYNLYLNPTNITKQQLNSLKILRDSGCIHDKLKIDDIEGYHRIND